MSISILCLVLCTPVVIGQSAQYYTYKQLSIASKMDMPAPPPPPKMKYNGGTTVGTKVGTPMALVALALGHL